MRALSGFVEISHHRRHRSGYRLRFSRTQVPYLAHRPWHMRGATMGTQGIAIAKSDTPDPRLMFIILVMTFVTGVLDAVSYVGLGHVFTANMTGNVVLLGFAIAGDKQLSVARSLVSLAAFLVGAVIGGRLGIRLAGGERHRWLLAAGVSEAVMLFIAASAAIGITAPVGVYAVIVFTAVAMGVRMATVRLLAIPDITTTVLTTTLAGLASESPLAGGNNTRFGRRMSSVVVMFAGAALGTLLLRFGIALPLVLGATCVLGATILYYLAPAEPLSNEQAA
jgi:uncharacterized membrane protein YoaK (UPF0700 family)